MLQVWPGVPFVSVLQNLRRQGLFSPCARHTASKPAPSAHLVSDGLLQELLPSAHRHLAEERGDGELWRPPAHKHTFSQGLARTPGSHVPWKAGSRDS